MIVVGSIRRTLLAALPFAASVTVSTRLPRCDARRLSHGRRSVALDWVGVLDLPVSWACWLWEPRPMRQARPRRS
jgi:hypothetical protein